MTLQRVYLVAGELSGDILGAGLIRELKARHPGVEFRGIGGPRMQAEGMTSRFPLETLAVMGLVEVLKHLPELIRVRRTLKAEALAWQPDIMLGIDAPDFNLGLERQLREAGIMTAHYVSPSVWAWRQGRVKGIVATRQALELAPDSQVLALLPGSRANEIRFLGDTFLAAAEQLCQRHPALQVLIPAATSDRRREISALLTNYPLLMERTALLDGQAREAMVASDIVLLASGTAALEAMLCHRSMLVAYKMAPMTHWLAKRMVKTQWVSLPNLIAQETLVPELIQEAASPEAIADQLSAMLSDEASRHALEARFAEMHATLQRNASRRAAEAISQLVAGQPLETVDGH